MGEMLEIGTLSRYDMSYYTFRQLQRDHIRFEEKYTEKFGSNFISRILECYMEYARNCFLDQFESDVIKCLENKPLFDDYTNSDDRISLRKPLVEQFRKFDFISHKDFKKRTVITYILEQFASLQLSEREKIYSYSQYETITKAIDNNEILIVRMSNEKEYEVKPFNLKIDENTLSYYFIGFSRPKGSGGGFECHSFKFSRIKECWSKHKESVLSSREIKSANEIHGKFGSAYMEKDLTQKDIEKSVVRLTEKGYVSLYLKIISHQRPIPINEPETVEIDGKKFYELMFDCSYRQIRNYFFSFGAEAEIISPLFLREKFAEDYKNALERYKY